FGLVPSIEPERGERLLARRDHGDRLVDRRDPQQLAEVALRAGDPHRARLAAEVAGAVEERGEARGVDEVAIREVDQQALRRVGLEPGEHGLELAGPVEVELTPQRQHPRPVRGRDRDPDVGHAALSLPPTAINAVLTTPATRGRLAFARLPGERDNPA